jgi:hypothetical protein
VWTAANGAISDFYDLLERMRAMILDAMSTRERFRPMKKTALRSKQVIAQDGFDTSARDLVSLWWSVPIWLALSAATWVALIYAASLFF